jgi:hypothetical protein
VGDHGIATTEGVLGVTQRVLFGRGLGKPHITTIAGEVAGLESLCDILLDDNGTASGVDEIRALLHLADKFLVEETLGLLMQRAVDCDNVTLGDELLEGIDTAGTNLLFNLGAQRLVVVVQKLLAVERLEATKDTLSNAADGNCADNLALEVVLLLGGRSDIPVTGLNLLVSGDEVTDEHQNSHDNMLSDGDDIAASDFGNGDATVGRVGSVEVDVVGTDTGGDGELEILGLGQTLRRQVTRVEGSSNDNLCVNELLVKLGVLALLVGSSDKGVALVLEPLADAQLVLGGSEELRNL